ncbi:CaiF/GrlA family transcriptional regulator [Salmonella enterica subsp. salamae]|uniref:CaiF/GrlA family transcriptional regulator n=16 Tax=Salmonella enterica TaxID=28901 RepID=A0A344QXK3_SALER|nr:CaiF/GrlA family transcriptional regulator [Salmonella enterica]AFO66330.1 putative LEE-encoded positive regulator of transcription [Salmonella enterica subsp. salamae serovar Sofia]EBI0478636.1 CaiF/GrlA family transcriptional regulator [Salmonella enterica subsp. enterica serovar Braenderup]EBK2700545.1 CaiF/GrlA family transcriptional regulator [Salmonella enterica subsp. enterica serovar Paratyphi B]ECG1420284.1 CaiF/GrlA family transcriptional regulator [Salmonella enterica subsp. salam
MKKKDDITLPESLSIYADEPLYILVSIWCKMQNKWISRNDITEAFGINLRRASFIMSYISRRKDRVTFRVRQVTYNKLHYKRLEIYVDDVEIEDPENKRCPVARTGGKVYRVGNGMVGQSNIWNEMLMRRNKKQ